MGKALRKPAAKLQQPPWGAKESIGYARFVQPVLDKHCGSCHQKAGTKAYEALNMVYRPSIHGWWNWVYDRPGDISPFAEPYYTLVNGNCGWGGAKPKDERGVPQNIAGLFIVEGYATTDPKNLETLPPYSAFSPVSKLVQFAVSGKHHDVKVTGEERERLIAWVDCNGPFLGDEELRNMYDPWSKTIETVPPIRPRIATAPRIERFNLRQDGDSYALCGPLKLQPDRLEGFNPNALVGTLRHDDLLRVLAKERLTVELVSATYGNNDEKKRVSVLDKLRPLFTGSRFIPMSDYNTAFGDPLPNIVKTLRIAYKINGGNIKHVQFRENEDILLPL
jgi:hypothetical protein